MFFVLQEASGDESSLSPNWAFYDLIVTVLMGLTAGSYALFLLGSFDNIAHDFAIYDSKGASKANIFLPKKLAAFNSTAANSKSQWAAFPGGPGRWTLPTDDTGNLFCLTLL